MILFRYVLGQYLKFVMGTLFLCVFLSVLLDFIHKSTRYFSQYNPPGIVILEYYLNQIPMQLSQAIPIASLLGSVVTMMILNRGNEVTAMRAAGMNPAQVGLPIFIGAAFLSLASFGVSNYLIPASAKNIHYIEQVVIQGDHPQNFLKKGQWFRDDTKFFTFVDYNPNLQRLKGLVIYEKDKNLFNLKSVTYADEAFYNAKKSVWELSNTRRILMKDKSEVEHKHLADSKMLLPIDPSKLTKDRRSMDQLSINELEDRIHRGATIGTDVVRLEVAYHSKIAFAFAALIICFIGIKFGYRSERTTEAVMAILLSVGLGVSYWFILSAGKVLSNDGTISPWLGPWLPNLILGAYGAFQLSSLNRA